MAGPTERSPRHVMHIYIHLEISFAPTQLEVGGGKQRQEFKVENML